MPAISAADGNDPGDRGEQAKALGGGFLTLGRPPFLGDVDLRLVVGHFSASPCQTPARFGNRSYTAGTVLRSNRRSASPCRERPPAVLGADDPDEGFGCRTTLTSNRTLERPALRAASTAATSCPGAVTGWLLTETMRSATLQSLLSRVRWDLPR